ncbi:PAS domain-containing protein [Desertivirga xinjiangensis]|uniref:PAS domain-containing protein n=1 Tax=Desertivirga xinjiangensis TaxID=539206 RepID=UPI0034E1BC41
MILIVDDIKDNLYSLKSVLEHNDFLVDTASSGPEALKKVLKTNYVLIILDVQMPGMDGFEVAEIISGYSKVKNTGIIFLSANYTDSSFILKGYNQGGIDYITKPVDPGVLLLKVKTLYQLYESRMEIQKQQQEITSLYSKEKYLNLELTQKRKKLLLTQKLAKLASWDFYVDSETLECSAEVYVLLRLNNVKPITLQFFLDSLSVADLDKFKGICQSYRSRGGRLEYEHAFKGEDGKIRYFKQYAKLERRNGVPYKLTGTLQDITDEKQRELEFLKLYERFTLVNKATNDTIWDWDLVNNTMEFNDNITHVFGYPKIEDGRTEEWWKKIVHPSDLKYVTASFEKAIIQHTAKWCVECRLKCFNGEYKDVFAQSFCLYDHSGQLIRMVTATKDLSPLKKIENQLHLSELKLLQTVETINEGFFTCNRSWDVTYWNNRSKELLGISKENALGQGLWELFPQARESRFYEVYSECIRSKRPSSFEEYYEPFEKWFRVSVHPSDEGIAVYFEDITGELMRDLELNDAKAKAELIKATSHDVIWEADINSNYVHFNKNLFLHFGYPSGTLTDKVWFRQRVHPEDIERVTKSLNKCIEEGHSVWEQEYRFLDAEGVYHHVHGKVYFTRNENNILIRMTGSITDMQPLKEKEFKLAEIAFSNSHLVRKPLANILGLIDLLSPDDSCEYDEVLHLIKASGLELDNVIKHIANKTT